MITALEHPRYREIPVENFDGQCPSSETNRLRIVLFSHDEELRSHTVKHLLNLQEFDAFWRGMLEMDAAFIHQSISRLQELGCPGMRLTTFTPPCKTGAGLCSFFKECGEVMTRLEAEYIRIVETLLEEGTVIPRYACFFSDVEQYHVFCLVPNRPAVVKASAVGDDLYNLMTCYTNPTLSFSEALYLQTEKIRHEARRRNIVFRTEESWGIHQDSALETERTIPLRKPYKKAKHKDWRKFLDEV